MMERAIAEAKKASVDVPVGAIILKNNQIIASCNNRKEIDSDVTSHAEILAIKEAQKKLNTKYLNDCIMYVTLEPCPMCAWAIIQARIKTVYFGSYDTQYGGFSVLNLNKVANSKIEIYGGINENECDILLKEFFNKIR